jgi:hypothetical protein
MLRDINVLFCVKLPNLTKLDPELSRTQLIGVVNPT